MTEMLNLTKSSMNEMSDHHTRDSEEAAKARAEEVSKLKTTHEEEVVSLAREKGKLAVRLSDLEGELATVKAELGSLKASPKMNGNGAAADASPAGVVTDEMLRQVHEAHNLKLGDLQAEHEKSTKALQQQLDDAQKKIGDLGAEVSRKAMEIQFMESEQDDHSETVTRYVKFFQMKSCIGGLLALAFVYGFL
jgi:transcriptional antiterminator